MITIDDLKKLGVDTDEAVARCVNDEGFYLSLVRQALEDDEFERLMAALDEKDLDEAFERAHALKGVYGNLSINSMYGPLCEITEELRARNDIDYSGYLSEMTKTMAELRALL